MGVFADILSQHENQADNLYWFKPENIIKFPIQELKYTIQDDDDRVNILIVDTIDIKHQNAEPIHYIFVVDKTLSKTPTLQEKKNIKDLQKTIKRRLGNDSIFLDSLQFQDREDIMLAGCVNKVIKEGNTYQVIVYNGEKDKYKDKEDTIYKEYTVIPTYDSLSDFLNKYRYNSYDDRKNRNTNFARIAEIINDTISKKQIETKMVITIFSDFIHEEKTENFQMVDKQIHKLSVCPNILILRDIIRDTIYHKKDTLIKKTPVISKKVKTILNLVDLEYIKNKK